MAYELKCLGLKLTGRWTRFYRSEPKKVAGDKLVRAATEVSKSMARKVSGAMPCQKNNLASSYPTAPCYPLNC